MQYNFDDIIDRLGTSCIKHDWAKKIFGREDITPMWVADMDFKSPDFVIDAIRHRCEHEVLGYTFGSDSYFSAIKNWLLKHYKIKAGNDELHFIPGIVAGISFCIETFTQKGDSILVMNPVYPPFNNLPISSDRKLNVCKLELRNGNFFIDFEDFAIKAKGCKLFILSNPHNPGGRVWTKDELTRIAEICYDNHVIVISDEIHADLTLSGYNHRSFASVSDKAKNNCLTFIAPSKTFNIAGLGTSIVYVNNQDIRGKYFGYLDSFEVANGNVFAYVGAEAAFSEKGEEWLSQLKSYLSGNVKLVSDFLHTEMPLVRTVLPQASYLVWMDFRSYNLSQSELEHILVDKAKVGLNRGPEFGEGYEGFMRMNIGCPRSILSDALYRIANALNN